MDSKYCDNELVLTLVSSELVNNTLNGWLQRYLGENKIFSKEEMDLLFGMVEEILVVYNFEFGVNSFNRGISSLGSLKTEVGQSERFWEIFFRKYLSRYLFEMKNKSVIWRRHSDFIEEEKVKVVLLNFVNYSFWINGWKRKFTWQELYECFKEEHYKKEMKELGEFLLVVDSYYTEFKNGENYDSLFDFILYNTNSSLSFEINFDAMVYAYARAIEDQVKVVPSSFDEEIMVSIFGVKIDKLFYV